MYEERERETREKRKKQTNEKDKKESFSAVVSNSNVKKKKHELFHELSILSWKLNENIAAFNV